MNERNGIGFCAWDLVGGGGGAVWGLLFGGLKELDIGIEKWGMRCAVSSRKRR